MAPVSKVRDQHPTNTVGLKGTHPFLAPFTAGANAFLAKGACWRQASPGPAPSVVCQTANLRFLGTMPVCPCVAHACNIRPTSRFNSGPKKGALPFHGRNLLRVAPRLLGI